MFLFWLLWLIIVFGGFYLGGGYALGVYREGFEISTALNAFIYLGCAIYGLPKLVKLILRK